MLLALLVYVLSSGVFAIVAGPERLTMHTPFNHYALLADAWLHGRQDLPDGPPDYAQNNDFAVFNGKTYISFPPFPAVLMAPFVKLAGSPEDFQDGQFVIWLAGVGPAVLFLVLAKLSRTGRSRRSEGANLALALLFAFGTVYFFTAVQGTVWFSAHVVGVGLAALYVLFALDAERPVLAGAMLACAWMTRPTMLPLGLLFALEAARVSCRDGFAEGPTFVARVRGSLARIDYTALARRYALFAAPLLLSFAVGAWMNYTRYESLSPFAFGHEHLTVQWRYRMAKWGLFGYHYLAKNLGVMLTILPWLPQKGAVNAPPLIINEHGLALWFTTPLYFWLFRPKRCGFLYDAVLVTALFPLALDLLYQNSGWRQFGYRFSNDYSVLLFVLLALGDRSFGWLFRLAALWSVAWNLFGAITFDRAEYRRLYFTDGSQTVLYQPD